jgi:uncharacterized protein
MQSRAIGAWSREWPLRAVPVWCPAGPDEPSGGRWAAFYSGQSAHGLDLPGMLAAVVNPLAQAALPVFVTSTYHADMVFVPAERRHEAAEILRRAGHVVHDATAASA